MSRLRPTSTYPIALCFTRCSHHPPTGFRKTGASATLPAGILSSRRGRHVDHARGARTDAGVVIDVLFSLTIIGAPPRRSRDHAPRATAATATIANYARRHLHPRRCARRCQPGRHRCEHARSRSEHRAHEARARVARCAGDTRHLRSEYRAHEAWSACARAAVDRENRMHRHAPPCGVDARLCKRGKNFDDRADLDESSAFAIDVPFAKGNQETRPGGR